MPPQSRLPRDAWRFAIDVEDVADLTAHGALAALGLAGLSPTRRQWPRTQAVGEALWRAGCRGLVAPSAAHEGGRVLAIFRPDRRRPPGLRSLRPPRHYTELPPLPTGLRT